jgi:hypothetical protein
MSLKKTGQRNKKKRGVLCLKIRNRKTNIKTAQRRGIANSADRHLIPARRSVRNAARPLSAPNAQMPDHRRLRRFRLRRHTNTQAQYQQPTHYPVGNTFPKGDGRKIKTSRTAGLIGFVVLAILVAALFLLVRIPAVGLIVAVAVLGVLLAVQRITAKKGALTTALLLFVGAAISFVLLIVFMPPDLETGSSLDNQNEDDESGSSLVRTSLPLNPQTRISSSNTNDFSIMIPGGHRL